MVGGLEALQRSVLPRAAPLSLQLAPRDMDDPKLDLEHDSDFCLSHLIPADRTDGVSPASRTHYALRYSLPARCAYITDLCCIPA